MTIGQKIYELRTTHNLSQGELAEKLDVSRQSVSKWETDAAIPDLDKLMKLCDLFGVTLDELVGRENESAKPTETLSPPSAQPVAHPAPNAAFTTQKIVGYILLAVALLGGILLAIFVDPLLAFMIALPMLICAIICIAAKRRAGYWCMWTVWFVFGTILNILVGKPMMGPSGPVSVNAIPLTIEAALYVILFIITFRVYKDEPLPTHKRKGIGLVIAWIVYLVLCILPGVMMYMMEHLNAFRLMLFYILPSLIPMIVTPFLFIYTARYLNGRKHTPK